MPKGKLTPSYRRRIGYQAGLLGGIAMFASAALVLGDLRTRDVIALRRAEDLKASLAQVIPASLHDNDLLHDAVTITGPDGQPHTFYRARRDGQLSAAAFQVEGQGYGGAIDLVMAVDTEGKILGVRVLAHSETPGLGDRIEAKKGHWILGFNHHSLSDPGPAGWHVKKDGGIFDQFTGATITPRAVVKAVHEGLTLFKDERSAVLADAPKDAPPEAPPAKTGNPS